MTIKITYLTGKPVTPIGTVVVPANESYLTVLATLHAAGLRIVSSEQRAN